MNSIPSDLPNFQDLFSDLLKKLKSNGSVQEVSNHFGSSHSIQDMFSYLWNLDEARSYLIPSLVNLEKSNKLAEKLRIEGNKYYKKKLIEKALDCYNQSILLASHPSVNIPKGICEKLKNNQNLNQNLINPSDGSKYLYETLAFGYGNRSAVLYELKLFDKCINDIEMAQSCGCPKLLQRKLEERKAKCLLAQGKNAEASEVINKLLQGLASLSIDDDKKKSSQEALGLLLQQASDRNPGNYSTTPNTESTGTGILYRYEMPEPPKLLCSNTTIPSLSSAVKLAYSATQGRYLVADRDIKPGEILIVEEGYSCVLHLDSRLKTYCSCCLSRCINPLPCPKCSLVIFCSNACRLRALASYHGRECTTLPSLSALDIGKNAVLAYRILMQTGFAQLKKMVPVYENEELSKTPETLGFNDEGIYDSTDYRTIFHLVGNKMSRSVSDLFKRCAMAVILLKLLEKSQQFFVDPDGASFSPSKEDILLSGTILFIHMMNLPCNAHSLTELQVNESNYQQSISQEIGCGAFGVLSLTNHSCNPTSTRVSYGRVEVLKAIRYIPEGAEVTDSYGEHYGMNQTESRRSSLMYQYHFTCSCEPCQQNWPLYVDLSSKLVLKCLQCLKPLDKNDKCSRCNSMDLMNKTENCEVENPCNYEEIGKKVILTVKKYEDSYREVLQGINSPENRNVICELIELYDKFLLLPNKIYFEAQETLKHCFDRLGPYNIMNT